MKKYYFTLITLLTLNSCLKEDKLIQQFSSKNDSLIIKTEKKKGDGLFGIGLVKLNFQNKHSVFMKKLVLPKDLDSIRRSQIIIDNKNKNHFPIDVIVGNKKGKNYFIVDQNNNRNLTDDTIREVKSINWFPNKNDRFKDLVKVKYSIFNGNKVVNDSSWLRIVELNDEVFFGKSEHLIGNFNIENDIYTIGIVDLQATSMFAYTANPELALLKENTYSKDTILLRDKLKLREYIKLGKLYYKFESITNNGDYITLIKEPNFDSKKGTQIGSIAPGFKAITTIGDTLRSENLSKKITILANSCACGGDYESSIAYNKMNEEYGDKFNIIRLDYSFKENDKGTLLDMNNSYNKEIYHNYRKVYCSRIAYMVDTNKRIINKFDITRWQENIGFIKN